MYLAKNVGNVDFFWSQKVNFSDIFCQNRCKNQWISLENVGRVDFLNFWGAWRCWSGGRSWTRWSDWPGWRWQEASASPPVIFEFVPLNFLNPKLEKGSFRSSLVRPSPGAISEVIWARRRLVYPENHIPIATRSYYSSCSIRSNSTQR